MPIYEIATDQIRKIAETTFGEAGVKERADLQRLLRSQIEIISPETLIVAEEFGEWEDAKRRIDLLGVDKDANLVVIELKRTEDGGHMDLQAVRYAAMVSTMTFDKVIEVYGDFLRKNGNQSDPRASLLNFLGWTEPDEDRFAQDVRIVLASAEFSKELTTAVLWLNDHGLDIRCVRIKPYKDSGRVLVDIQPIIPLPEAQDFQVQIKEKQQRERAARTASTRQKITEEEFLQEIRKQRGDAECAVAERLIRWAKNDNLGLNFNKGQLIASFIPVVQSAGEDRFPLSVQSGGKVYLQMNWLRKHPPFSDDNKLKELWGKLKQVPDADIALEQMAGQPSIFVKTLLPETSLKSFLDAMTWLVSELRSCAV